MKKLISVLLITVLGTLLTSAALADTKTGLGGFIGLTHFSRANCVNNESISWDNTADQIMLVRSRHRLHKINWGRNDVVQDHVVTSGGFKSVKKGGALFDGAKAIHWGEGVTAKSFSGVWPHIWHVYGQHLYFINGNPNFGVRQATSFATWCLSDSQYNG